MQRHIAIISEDAARRVLTISAEYLAGIVAAAAHRGRLFYGFSGIMCTYRISARCLVLVRARVSANIYGEGG